MDRDQNRRLRRAAGAKEASWGPMKAMFSSRDVTRLRDRMDGSVLLPGGGEYDAARQVWNVRHDYSPALITQPRSVADVQAAVGFAYEQGLAVSVRGGGHNHAGYAVADGALLLDMSAMSSVEVDAERHAAVVGGGATWGVVDRATQQAGLAVTGADVSAVGVGGSTLGGGVGWLHRRFGLSCDNLLGAVMVTADASVRRVSAREHPDLFWALRGGGGNFGVVTALTFALHPVGPVPTATVICPIERAAEALDLYQGLCASGGDELFVRAMLTTAPLAPFVPDRLRGRPAVMLSAAWFGPTGEAEAALGDLRQLASPGANPLRQMRYVDLQRVPDATVPRRVRAASAGGFTGPLSGAAIDALCAAAAEVPPMSMVELQPLGGAVARVPTEATAFRYRTAAHVLAVFTMALPEEDDAQRAEWVGKVTRGLPTGTVLGPSVLIMGRGEPERRVRAAYGDTAYARLAAVKRAYDPANTFRFNQNVRPHPAETPSR